MQQNTITLFATVGNAPKCRVSKTGRNSTAFGVAVRDSQIHNLFNYNVVAFDRPAEFASKLNQTAYIKLVCSSFSQPDNDVTIPLLTATFVRPIHAAEN